MIFKESIKNWGSGETFEGRLMVICLTLIYSGIFCGCSPESAIWFATKAYIISIALFSIIFPISIISD